MKYLYNQTIICILTIVIMVMFVNQANAQKMEFTFSNLAGVQTKYLYDGTTLVQLPAGTSLSSMANYGMSVRADGTNAPITEIVPNPSTKTDYVDGGLNVFYYKGKAYKVRFSSGEYFTAVFFSDAKLGSASSLSKTELANFADRVTKLGTANGPIYQFDALPGFIPTADIAFYLGNMNATTSQTPLIHTLGDDYMNIVNKCAVVAGQIENTGTSATITEYGLCYGTNENPTTSNTYKAAADLGVTDDNFGDAFNNVFGVYFDNLDGGTTYHVRAYCKYTLSGSNTVYTTYGEDKTFTTPGVSGFHWQWEGGETPDDAAKARIEEAMNGASEYYNHYCTLYKWCGCAYISGVQTADCSLRQDGSCYIRFGPGERYQWVGTAQHEISHGYGVGQTGAFAGYPSPFLFRVATLTIRVFLRSMTEVIYHDSQHYWPGGINQREEVTNGTANNKGTYTCYNEEMLKCNAMILNGLAKDGMQTWYGWAKDRGKNYDTTLPDGDNSILDNFAWTKQRDNGPNKVSQASNASASDFEDALDKFNQAGIPLILAPGNLDLASLANSDGKTLNNNTFAAVTRSINEAQNYGVSNLQRFTNGQSTSTYTQPQPFTFTFKGVRFYNGQRSWFDEPLYNSGTTYRWIIPDNVYSNLQTFVNSHTSETSIWMQHIPMNASDADWYETKTRYNNNASGTSNGSYNSAAKRRTALANLIQSTANSAMFSGHAGTYNDNNYNSRFHDYTVANLNNTPCDAYIVLMKAGTGVVEVKQLDFRDYQSYSSQFDDPATEYTSGQDNAMLAGLVQGMTTLSTGNASLNIAVNNAKSVTNAADVTSSINAINTAFDNYVQGQGDNVDVSGILGDNLDFETTKGTQNPDNDKLYAIPGWNENVMVHSTTNAYLDYKTGQGSQNGGNTLYIRENWKGNPALKTTLQVYKDAVLPTGNYLLQFEMRIPSNNFSQSLNYYELDGVRTYFDAGTSWETKSIQLSVSQPTTLRLSFGFVGSVADGNRPCEVDVDNIKLMWEQQAMAEGKESMDDDGWTKITALPSDYSKYFFALYDHTQDLGLVRKAGVHQGSGNQTMWYESNVTPGLDKTALWTFDSNVDGETEYVVIANATYPNFMYQTEWNASWHYRTNDNGDGDISWGRTLISYAENKWTIQNGKYQDAGYLGPWENTITNNAEVALNKTGDAIGYFDIFSILRGKYVANYETLSGASTDTPLNITYVLENPGGERRNSIGWKTNGAGWWSQGSTAINGKVGDYFLESWNGGGLADTDLYQEIYELPNGKYRFSAIANCSSNCVLYANSEQVAMPTNNPGTRTSVVVDITDGYLRVGAKTGTNPGSWIAFDDAKLEFLGTPDEYFVGTPVTSIIDGAYVQQFETVTIEYPYASTSDGESVFAILNGSATMGLYKSGDKVADGTLSLSGKILTATFSGYTIEAGSDYTIQLPADVVGFAGHVANTELSLNFYTPAVWDGTYYLYNTYTNNYLSRGGTWATACILDDWGLALLLATDSQGRTTLKYFDSQAYLFNDGYCWADGATGLNFTVTKTGNNYKFFNISTNNSYLGVYQGRAVSDAREGDNLVGTSNVWTLESTAEHVDNYTRCANSQATMAANSAGLSGITTKAELDDMGYLEIDGLTGDKAEKYQVYAEQAETLTEAEYYKETVEGLTPGLYRLSVDAFQRAGYFIDVAEADGARGCIYVYANDVKTQIKSVMEHGENTAYTGEEAWADYEYAGIHYPNSLSAGYSALDAGNYNNVVYVYVPADDGQETGTITFGINNPNRLGNGINRGTWCVYENFRLERIFDSVTLDETSDTPPPTVNNVTVNLNRTIKANQWNTICLPFNMSNSLILSTFGNNTQLVELAAVRRDQDKDENVTLTFSTADDIEANKPYIIRTDVANNSYTFNNIDLIPSEELTTEVEGVQFIGNYTYPTVMANENGEDYYILDNTFKHSTGKTKIKGYRAYFHVPEASGIKAVNFDIDDTTGLMEITNANNSLPADIYGLGGQLIRKKSNNTEGLPKGVYIVNGKKMVVK